MKKLLIFAGIAVALVALSHVPGNPRYLITLMSVLPALIADAFGTGWRRAVLAILIAVSAMANLSQLPEQQRAEFVQFVTNTEGLKFVPGRGPDGAHVAPWLFG